MQSNIFIHPDIVRGLKAAGLYYLGLDQSTNPELVTTYTGLPHELAVVTVTNRTYYNDVVLPHYEALKQYTAKYADPNDSLLTSIGDMLNAMDGYVRSKLQDYDVAILMLADELGVSTPDPGNLTTLTPLMDAAQASVTTTQRTHIIDNLVKITNAGARNVSDTLDAMAEALD